MQAAIVQGERRDCVIRKFNATQFCFFCLGARLGMVYDFDNGRCGATETYWRH
jgi:hypothetical protein